jgi:glyoxylase-like metal-dependent hydrolase (beta-lactamase superfamily II)
MPSSSIRFVCVHSKELVDWLAESGSNLATIYATHAQGEHFFDLKISLDKFPNVRALAAAVVVAGMQNETNPDFVKSFWEPRFPGQVPSQLAVPEILEGNTLYLESSSLTLWKLAIFCNKQRYFNFTGFR